MTTRRHCSGRTFALEALEIRTAPSHHGALAHALTTVHHRELTPHVEVSTLNRTESGHASENISSPDTGIDSQDAPNATAEHAHTDSQDSSTNHR
jgi:hypothetical protein